MISVTTSDGLKEVHASVRKGLAIIDDYDGADEVEFFNVTHVGTGARLGKLFCGENRAQAIVDKIVDLQDWEKVKTGSDVLPETKDALRNLSEEHNFLVGISRQTAE